MVTTDDYISYINYYVDLHRSASAGSYKKLFKEYLGEDGKDADPKNIKALAEYLYNLEILSTGLCDLLPDLDISQLTPLKRKHFLERLDNLLIDFGLLRGVYKQVKDPLRPPKKSTRVIKSLEKNKLTLDQFIEKRRKFIDTYAEAPEMDELWESQAKIEVETRVTTPPRKASPEKKKKKSSRRKVESPKPPSPKKIESPKRKSPSSPKKEKMSEFQIMLRECTEKYSEAYCKKAKNRPQLRKLMAAKGQ